MSSNPSLTDGTAEAACAAVRRWIHAASLSGDPTPPSPELSAHVERCAVCQGALLLLIAAGTELLPSTSSTTCQQCLDDLAAYIEQELEDTGSAIRVYPQVWWHLLTCHVCAETYRLTRAMVEAERSGQVAPPPRPRRTPFFEAERSGQVAPPPRRRLIPFFDIVRLKRHILNLLLAPSPMLGTVTRGSARQPIILVEDDNIQGYAISLSVEPQPDGAWRVMIGAAPPPVGDMVLTLGEATFRNAFDTHGVAVVSGVAASLLVHPGGPDLVVSIDLDQSC